MAVAIWTTSRDKTADLVGQRLRERTVRCVRLDTDRYGEEFRISWNGAEALFTDASGRTLPGGEISSVYYRRPSLIEIPRDERDFAMHETWYFSRAVLLGLKCTRWMNHPGAVLEAENKLKQLEVAQQLGFCVPRSLLTSDHAAAWTFYEATGRQCVSKPGYAGMIATGKQNSVVYACRLPKTLAASDFASVRSCPTFFQEEIEKTSDVRVTAVGSQLFATRIISRTPNLLDWRQEIGNGLRYEPLNVPPDTARRITALLEALGLHYGALDFAETPTGDWIFFEVNPAGQWGWLELEAGLPISAAVASWLSGA